MPTPEPPRRPRPGDVVLAAAGMFLVLFVALVVVFAFHGGPDDGRRADRRAAIRSYLVVPFADAPDLGFLTRREEAHLLDVKERFDAAWLVTAASVGTVVAVAAAWRSDRGARRLRFARAGYAAGVALLVALPTVGLVALVDFDAFWTGFHGVLFPAGGWQFPDGSSLLALYPDSYFEGFVAWYGAIVLAVAIGLVVGGARAQANATRSSRSSSK